MTTLDGNVPPGTPPPSGPPKTPPNQPTGPGRPPANPPPSKGLLALLVAIPALLLLAGCVPPAGAVASKSISTKDGQVHYYLCTKSTADDSVRCGEVDSKVWRACDVGDFYDQDPCDSSGSKRGRVLAVLFPSRSPEAHR